SAEGHFAAGSMLPKVEAAIKFAETKPGRRAVIASLEKAPLAITGESGTIITL
ncbi:MAG: carbamate kinase, partial [Oscillospiraceae bacterium]